MLGEMLAEARAKVQEREAIAQRIRDDEEAERALAAAGLADIFPNSSETSNADKIRAASDDPYVKYDPFRQQLPPPPRESPWASLPVFAT